MNFKRVGQLLAKTAGMHLPSGLGAGLAKAHDFAPGLQTLVGAAGGAFPGYLAGEAIDKDSTMSKGVMTTLGAILGGQVGNPLFRKKMVGIGNPDLKRNAPWYDPKRKEILQSTLIKNILGPKVAAGGLIFGGKLVNDWSSLTGSLRNAAANVDETTKSVKDTVKGSSDDVKRTAKNVADASDDAKSRVRAVGGNLETTSKSVADAAANIRDAKLGTAASGALAAVDGIKSSVDKGTTALTDASNKAVTVANRGLDTMDRVGNRIDDAWAGTKRAMPWVAGGAGALGLGGLLYHTYGGKKKRSVDGDPNG